MQVVVPPGAVQAYRVTQNNQGIRRQHTQIPYREFRGQHQYLMEQNNITVGEAQKMLALQQKKVCSAQGISLIIYGLLALALYVSIQTSFEPNACNEEMKNAATYMVYYLTVLSLVNIPTVCVSICSKEPESTMVVLKIVQCIFIDLPTWFFLNRYIFGLIRDSVTDECQIEDIGDWYQRMTIINIVSWVWIPIIVFFGCYLACQNCFLCCNKKQPAAAEQQENQIGNENAQIAQPAQPDQNEGIQLQRRSTISSLRRGLTSSIRKPSDIFLMMQARKKVYSQGSQLNKECKTCCICTEDFKDDDIIDSLPCNEMHIFHTKCIQDWLEKKTECPICRAEVVFHEDEKLK